MKSGVKKTFSNPMVQIKKLEYASKCENAAQK